MSTHYYFEKKIINGKTYQYIPRWNQKLKKFQLILAPIDGD